MPGSPRPTSGPPRFRRTVLATLLLVAAPILVPPAWGDCRIDCQQEARGCVATECATLAGTARRACARACRERTGCLFGGPAVRTLAYVLTECHDTGGTLDARQALRVRRGRCPEESVVEAVGHPVGGLGPLCSVVLGGSLLADNALAAGVFTRLGISRDGSTVAFERTTRFSLVPALFDLPGDEEGLYVRADGQSPRRLGDASRAPSFGLGGTAIQTDATIDFSPNGRFVVFTDQGPGPDGAEERQVVVVDVRDGTRTQVTRLPRVPEARRHFVFATGAAKFFDNDTIFFGSYTNPDGLNPENTLKPFTIDRDGRHLGVLKRPDVLAGAPGSLPLVPSPGGGQVLNVVRAGEPENPEPGQPIVEVFLVNPRRSVLQLTNLRRIDTDGQFLDTAAGRVFFRASADPFGTNPQHDCQLFSIDVLGAGLRQVTFFDSAAPSIFGCAAFAPPGCGLAGAVQDPASRTVVFSSSCDPLGSNPHGAQVFAMRPGGSGLRQLTSARGVTTTPGETVVELPGPFAYPGRSSR